MRATVTRTVSVDTLCVQTELTEACEPRYAGRQGSLCRSERQKLLQGLIRKPWAVSDRELLQSSAYPLLTVIARCSKHYGIRVAPRQIDS